MTGTRNASNAYSVVDYTSEILLIPNKWGYINSLGLFETEGVAKNTLEFDLTTGTIGLLQDAPRGVRHMQNSRDRSELHAVPIPHFNLDDAIKPEDVQGRRKVGTAHDDETLANVRAKKMNRLRMAYAATQEYARSKALQGDVYAPNNTVSINWYTEMGVQQKVVDFVLGTNGTIINEKCEDVIAHIQDNIMSGQIIDEILVLCSPGFFSKLIKHPVVEKAFTYYQSSQEPLRNRLGRGLYREFVYAGLRFVEYRGKYGSNDIIPTGDAYAFPLGTSDLFVTYFGPANKFEYVNTPGLEQYMFEYSDGRDTEITIETESNFLNMVKRPQAVVRCHSSN